MKEFETHVTASLKATITSYNVGSIIEKEKGKLLGSPDRFIDGGVVKERDYRFNGPETIREATEEEIELYQALSKVAQYFKNL